MEIEQGQVQMRETRSRQQEVEHEDNRREAGRSRSRATEELIVARAGEYITVTRLRQRG